MKILYTKLRYDTLNKPILKLFYTDPPLSATGLGFCLQTDVTGKVDLNDRYNREYLSTFSDDELSETVKYILNTEDKDIVRTKSN